MKRFVLFMVLAVAVGLGLWPTYAPRVRAALAGPEVVATTTGRADARPESLAIGGALLVLVSILRRNLTGRAR
jgi:hypothetical protein